MSTKNTAVEVDDVAVRLDSSTDTADTIAGQAFAFYNTGPDTVYIGDSTVTDDDGLPVAAGSWSPGLALGTGDHIYGVCATGDTAEVRVLEVGV